MGNTLMSLQGQKWKDMRGTLSPAFTGSKMRLMFELVRNCVENGSQFVADQRVLEMKDFFSKFTVDIIATCAFGIEVNSFENPGNEFYDLAMRVMNRGGLKSLLKFIGFKLFSKLMKFMKIELMEREVSSFFRSFVNDSFEHRRKNKIVRNDMINLLIEAVDYSPKHWTNDEIIAQCMTFFLAGFRTTSTALSLAAYELALNDDIQSKLRSEVGLVRNSLDGNSITYDGLMKMRYMDMFVSELLRKWPPAAGKLQIFRIFVISDQNISRN
jgi:cytochrome P450 family 9